QTIGREVWGAIDGQKVTENRFGLGRVVWGRPLATVLPPPDFDYDRATGTNLVFTHRRDGEAEIYFVTNQGAAGATVAATFRVAGKMPELWDAETGEITKASAYAEHDGRTTVPLHLREMGSIFVIFRRPASPDAIVGAVRNGGSVPLTALLQPDAGSYSLTTAAGVQLHGAVTGAAWSIPIAGPWTVRFPVETGATAPLAYSSLVSWSDSALAPIRYFSGTANYTADFLVPPGALQGNQRVQLDLGRVEKFAGLTLNGRPLRLLWHAPYLLDVTAAVQPGQNHLEIAVTNLLVNRLIGDRQRPENERRMWSTHQPYTKDSLLLPSGLLGPVQLVIRPQLTLTP
ncbi:MAG: glycosylhydrolase-like jelly roll fold domain-containing protein, partial [Opitutales bacterium]